MEQKATIKNRESGVTYQVTRSEWDLIRGTSLGPAYELIQDFPPVVNLEDLPEVQAIYNTPSEDLPGPEEPADLTEGEPNDMPESKPAGGKKKGPKN